MTEMGQLVGTVGFPIAIALILSVIILKMFMKYAEDMKILNDTHREEITKFTEALNSNTLALQKLCDRLDEKGDDGK